jgi:hypothetical protein
MRITCYLNFRFIVAALALASACASSAHASPADVVGSWRLASHTITFDGTKMDSHAALLQQRPCAAKIRYKINADGTYRLDASASDCDDKYKKIQEKLYSKTTWKLDGNKITAAGQTYLFTVAAARMTWVGTNGQGLLCFRSETAGRANRWSSMPYILKASAFVSPGEHSLNTANALRA